MIMLARLKLLVYFTDGFFVKCYNCAFHNDFFWYAMKCGKILQVLLLV